MKMLPDPSFRLRSGRPVGGFALVLSLIILSVLAIVAVSYLASMSAERGTANAFANRARAEHAAQAASQAAMAVLADSFQAFPDSATVWDTHQSRNNDQDDSFNAGTSLYLRALPTTAAVPDPAAPAAATTVNVTVPDPAQDNRPPTAPPTASGSSPTSDARRTFVLPLVSGVGNGRPRLVSEGRPKPLKGPANGGTLPEFDLAETDEATFTDLNTRRFPNDLQGTIGSPPGWGKPSNGPKPTGPKPARARWVDLKDKAPNGDDVTLARYAFFVEDESFKLNVNLAGRASARADNANDFGAPNARRAFAPGDLSLLGPLAALDAAAPSANADSEAASILAVRNAYPASAFPEPRGFRRASLHTPGADTYPDIYGDPALSGPQKTARALARYEDHLGFLTSTTSGALNLSRHGSHRVNLNALVSATPGNPGIVQREVNQLVQALRFHLPFWGQRFYRLTAATDSPTLNRATEVSGNADNGHARIYYHKTAANLRDYVDADSQPTVVLSTGSIAPTQAPELPFGEDGTNPVWAQGKDSVPLLQETVVRFRPVVSGKSWTLGVDYYLEFWNMTNKDIYAAPQPGRTVTHLQDAFVRVTSQQTWTSNTGRALRTAEGTPARPFKGAPYEGESDYNINLTQGVFQNGSAGSPMDGQNGRPLGVVFRAGAVTIITTDPDCATYDFKGPPGGVVYTSLTGKTNPATTYYCSTLTGGGRRQYAGSLIVPPETTTNDNGIRPTFRDTSQDYGTEVTLGNALGYLDCFQFAVAEGGGAKTTTTNNFVGQTGTFNDYGYGGSLFGNGNAPSQLGDPRTNNEQIKYTRFVNPGNPTTAPDQSRYWNGDHSLGYPNGNYVTPDGGKPWPDYYKMPASTSPAVPYPNPDATNSPAVVADALLTSIGQLGDVFDPARVPAVNANNQPIGNLGIEASRGGGRSLRIGQRDDRFHPDPSGNASGNNTPDAVPASNGWAAWRLTDVFATDHAVRLPGRLNLNGIARDGGAALRAALTDYRFQPITGSDPLIHGDRLLAGRSLDPNAANVGFDALVKALAARVSPPPVGGTATALTLPRPLFERGELGEVSGNVPVAGVNLAQVFDRGREELFRRLVEMTCTRGDTFTVHCVGQAIVQPNAKAPKRVAATQRLRVTFRLVPKNANGTPFQPGYTVGANGEPGFANFDPADPNKVAERFAKPDRYDIEILQASAASL